MKVPQSESLWQKGKPCKQAGYVRLTRRLELIKVLPQLINLNFQII
jgi:hypothetical protein